MPNYNQIFLPIDELIEKLKLNGFSIGTDTILQLHSLLKSIDLQKDYSQLHTFLCPLFASDEKQQDKFFKIYAEVFDNEKIIEQNKIRNKTHQETKKSDFDSKQLLPDKPQKRRLLYFIAIILAVFLSISAFLIIDSTKNKTKINKQKIVQNIDSLEQNKQVIEQKNKDLAEDTAKLKTDLQDTLEKINDPEIADEVKDDYEFRITEKDNIINKNNALKDSAENEIANNKKNIDEIEQEKKQKYLETIRYSLLLIILFAFLFYELYLFMIRRLIAKRKRAQKPPFVWGIYLEDQNIDLDSEIYSVANNMRFRTQTGVSKIDIKQTINATVKNAGIPILKHTYNSKPVEYLMLIDWSSEKNHLAQLFDYLYRTFEQNNVYIERFFYNVDPRICWNNSFPEGIAIDKIQTKFPDAYLLVFGNGEKFINPLNKSLFNFTKIFFEWDKRALLSPEPSAEWGVREVLLRNAFQVILPANTQGLIELTEHFNIKSGLASDLKDWKFNPQKAENNIFVNADNLQENKIIPNELKTWIAACAVYPELYWDLTIAIGKNITAKADNFDEIATQQNIALLARIDWFRNGKIPDAEREKLLQNKKLLPDKLKNIAISTVVEVLEKNLPAAEDLKDSIAYQKFLMNIVVSKLMLKPKSRNERRILEQKLKQLAQTNEEQDFVALEYISKSNRKISDFLLPKKFKKFFFNNANKFLGVKNYIRYAFVIFLMIFTFTCNNKQLFENIKPDIVDTTITPIIDTIQDTNIMDDVTFLKAKNENTIDAFENYISDFPQGKHVQEANVAIVLLKQNTEKADWQLAQNAGTKKVYKDFIIKYPNSVHIQEAKDKIKQIEDAKNDDIAFYKAQDENTIEAFDGYISVFPQGKHVQEANEAIDLLKQNTEKADWQLVQNAGTIKVFDEFLTKYPNSIHVQEAKDKIKQIEDAKDQADFATAQNTGTCYAYKLYKQQHPQGKYLQEANDKIDDLCSAALIPQMVFVKGGSFKMGSNVQSDEKPIRDVTVGDFYIGKYEVTFEEYDKFCDATGRNKPYDEGWGRGKRPVINVSWNDVTAYCKWLSQQTGKTYRLPTEAEWEYAAGGGQNSPLGKGVQGDVLLQKWAGTNNESSLGSYAWYSSNSNSKTHPVGTKQPNSLGIYDLSGNVWEWCSDKYGSYSSSSQTNPQGPSLGTVRVIRGGSWSSGATFCRVANRNRYTPTYSNLDIGFRICRK